MPSLTQRPLVALFGRAESIILRNDRFAEQSDVPRVHGRECLAVLIQIINRGQVEKTFVHHFQEVVGVDRPHDPQRRLAAAGFEDGELPIEVDVCDRERQRLGLCRIIGACRISDAGAFLELAAEAAGQALGPGCCRGDEERGGSEREAGDGSKASCHAMRLSTTC